MVVTMGSFKTLSPGGEGSGGVGVERRGCSGSSAGLGFYPFGREKRRNRGQGEKTR
jgi:hypothetical protein